MRLAIYMILPLLGLTASPLLAQQSYPSAPLTLIVPYPPGASTDILGRIVAKKMSESLGQQVIVENKGGAGGTVGSRMVSQAKPDGYTFLLGTSSTHVGVKYMMKHRPYDPQEDFTPIAKAVEIPIGLAVHTSVPANNVQELIAHIKSNPDVPFSYASSGVGSAHHLAGAYFVHVTGLNIVHVAYRGGGPALNDLLGGQIPMAFTTLATVLPHLEEHKVKVLGVVEKKRASFSADIPSISESVPAYTMPATWLGFFGPPAMPTEIVETLYSEIRKALMDPDVSKQLNDIGLVVAISGPNEFRKQIADDLNVVESIVADANLQPE